MPGPVSDSYDPEWGTGENKAAISSELEAVYRIVSSVVHERPPVYILNLVRADMPQPITATLTEKQWRMIRFAIERAGDSL